MRTGLPLVAMALGCLLAAGPCGAQQPPPVPAGRVELWIGVTRASQDIDSEIPMAYVPEIESYGAALAGSTVAQTVRIEGASGAGFAGGISYFFGPRVGVQAFVERGETDLAGANSDFYSLLNYTARMPPDYVSREYSFSRTDAPCGATEVGGCVHPTTGELRETTIGFDLVGRWPLGRRVTAAVSAGLSIHRLSGGARPLRYRSFRMGGHSTLFYQDYEAAYSLEADTTGFNVGGTIDVGLGRAVALAIDARRFVAPGASSAVKVTKVVNEDEVVFEKSLDALQAGLAPPDVTLDPSRTRLAIGLKLRF